MGLDRKNPYSHRTATGVFHQRGIAVFPDDVLINRSRLGSVEKFGFGRFAIDVHGELVDGRALRQWEDISALQGLVVWVEELLIDARYRDAVVDFDVNVMKRHLKRRKGKMIRP